MVVVFVGARREEAGGGRRGEEGSEEGTYFVLAASSSKRHGAAEWREGGKRGRACARGWRGRRARGTWRWGGGGVVVGWCVGGEVRGRDGERGLRGSGVFWMIGCLRWEKQDNNSCARSVEQKKNTCRINTQRN